MSIEIVDFSPLCHCNHRKYEHIYDMTCSGRTLIEERKGVLYYLSCNCKKYKLNNLAYLEQKYEESLV